MEDPKLRPPATKVDLGPWKDAVALARDTLLLLLVVLLIAFPATLNGLLVSAGFEEGSIVGFKWKAKLVESDQALKELQANTVDLRKQNGRLEKELTELQSKSASSPEAKARLAELLEENARLKQTSARAESHAQSTIASTAALVEKATVSGHVQWGVVYGGDASLSAAKKEVAAAAQKHGGLAGAVYLRDGSYRSVATTTDRSQAEQLLFKAKNHRGDAYIINMGKWCPRPVERVGFFECGDPT